MGYSKNSSDSYTKFTVEPGKLLMGVLLTGNLGLIVESKAAKVK